eukprot:gene4051-8057_t
MLEENSQQRELQNYQTSMGNEILEGPEEDSAVYQEAIIQIAQTSHHPIAQQTINRDCDDDGRQIANENVASVTNKSSDDSKKIIHVHKSKMSYQSILNEIDRLKEKHSWSKLFKSRIQPTESIFVDPTPENQGRKKSIRASKRAPSSPSSRRVIRPKPSNVSTRPNTAPPCYFLRNRPGLINTHDVIVDERPSTAHTIIKPQIPSNNIDESSDFLTILKQSQCSTQQFKTAFNKQCQVSQQNATEIYEQISTSINGGMNVDITMKTSKQIHISKKVIRELKKNNNNNTSQLSNGMIILMDPRTNTMSTSCSLKLSYESNNNENNNTTGINSNANANTNTHTNENSNTVVLMNVISGNGRPFHLQLTTHSLPENHDEDDDDEHEESRILPGWQGTLPLWIPSLKCTVECHEIGCSYHNSSDTLDNLSVTRNNNNTNNNNVTIQNINTTTSPISKREKKSKPSFSIGMFAFPAESLEAGLQALLRCQERRVANMLMCTHIPALNIAAMNGNLN